MLRQMMVAMFHSNGQLRTEDGDKEKGCHKSALLQKTTDDYDDDDDDDCLLVTYIIDFLSCYVAKYYF